MSDIPGHLDFWAAHLRSPGKRCETCERPANRSKIAPARVRKSTTFDGCLILFAALTIIALASITPASANSPGATNGTGPNVTVVDNGDGTVTMANGIVSIVIVKATSRLNSVLYTHSNSGTSVITQMLDGNGEYYYGGFMLGNGAYTYSLATDPATNGGNYADAEMVSNSATNGVMETHFSMLRGSPGFYSTAIMTHRAQDAAYGVTAWGVVTRVPGEFNWASADATRNFFVGSQTTSGVAVPDSPHEISINLNGAQAGQYADKFIYGQDHGDQKAWGWSTVGTGALNVGTWIMTTLEFSDGGPLKRDVGVYPYNVSNNSILTGELNQGSDGNLAAGEIWTKTCGPWFIYMNSTTTTGTTQAAQALFNDATTQAAAEAGAWPYSWFSNPNYVPASGRGTVTGQIAINDPGNPNPTLQGTWVGVEEQPITSATTYDFQKWLKPYQFWTQTDAKGNFTIPNVIAGTNYTLYAYGPGAIGELMSQNQTGGNPPLNFTLPATPFSVTVNAGQTTSLGKVTWSPARVGPTVFELGYPDRKADEFRHGEDFWAPAASPQLGYPLPNWGGQTFFPLDFPNGVNYTVGQSKWDTAWNYVLPSLPNANGNYLPATETINFNLAAAPATGAQASIYLAAAGDDGGNLIISVNGTNLGTASGVTATPNAESSTGINPPSGYQDDSSIHFSDHGPFWDERITFPGSLLKAGTNTITINMNSESLTSYLMVDYLRLELTGYVPPPPASVTAYPGNHSALVTWPVVPGSNQYSIYRSTSPGSGYVSIGTGLTGPVSGSDSTIMTYTDTTAVNGTPYYYEVTSWNPQGGSSADSPPSNSVAPSQTLSTSAPAAPTGLQLTTGDRSVGLTWSASTGANYYSVSRTTLYPDGNGGTISLRTIVLNDNVSSASFADTTPTDGKTYSYAVQATSAAGTSALSTSATTTPLSTAVPTMAPAGLSAYRDSTGAIITLNWAAVPGATGYVIYRSTTAGGPFVFPANFVNATPQTDYTDSGLSASTVYYYQVTAVNFAGISSSSTVSVPLTSTNPVVTKASVTAPVGGAFSYTITATNSPYSYNATGLPPGLTVNTTTGVISGTPTATGTTNIALSATNSSGTGTATLVLTVNGEPYITSPATASVLVNTAFNYTITAQNGPTSFNATGLPTGLTVNTATGVISGTPTSSGTFSVSLSATNLIGTDTQTLTLMVVPPAPVISSATATAGATGYVFNYSITASNTPTSFGATNLPPGLALNATTGLISGTPTTTGTYTVGLSAGNAGGTATASLTVTITPPGNLTLIWTGSVNTTWDTITTNWASSGTVEAYTDPDPVTFDDTGSGGTVTVSGTHSPGSVTVNTSSKTYSLAGPGYLMGPMTLTKSGSTALGLSGANTYTGGTLLLNGQLSVSANNAVLGSGTLTFGSSGDANTVIVRANSINLANAITVNAGGTRWIEPGNGNGVTYTGAITLNGGATLNLSTVGGNITLSGGITGTGNIFLSENGGSRANSETLSTNAVNNTGTISDAGNPDTGGAFISANIGMNVTGITQNSSSEAMTLSGSNAFNGPITITAGTLSLGGAGVLGSGVYTGAISNSGTLKFNSTAAQTMAGPISGNGALTDTGAGVLTLAGIDNYTGATTVSAGTLLINGSVTSAVSVAAGATLGGAGKITGNVTEASGSGLTFNVTTSSVAGLTINGNLALNGTINVTPTILSGTISPGTYPIATYTGTFSGTPSFVWTPPPGNTLTANFDTTSTPGVVNLIVNPPPPMINSPVTATATVGSAFSYNITATNTPTSFYATGLPFGLAINTTTGAITGTPTTAGTAPINISATNGGGTGMATLTLTLNNPPPPMITSADTATATADAAFSYTITATNMPTSYSATGLPMGLTVNTTTGAITGTPATSGTSTITLSATNAGGTNTETLTLTVNAAIATSADTPTMPPWALVMLAALLFWAARTAARPRIWASCGSDKDSSAHIWSCLPDR